MYKKSAKAAIRQMYLLMNKTLEMAPTFQVQTLFIEFFLKKKYANKTRKLVFSLLKSVHYENYDQLNSTAIGSLNSFRILYSETMFSNIYVCKPNHR